jgi:hypothetical protein
MQLHSMWVSPGARRYGLRDLDKPVKSLGPDFYVELAVEDGPAAAAQGIAEPWRSDAGVIRDPMATLFFTDAEARGLIKTYERDVGRKLGEAIAGPGAAQGPSDSSPREAAAPVPAQTQMGDKETPAINSLIDFGPAQYVHGEWLDAGQRVWAVRDAERRVCRPGADSDGDHVSLLADDVASMSVHPPAPAPAPEADLLGFDAPDPSPASGPSAATSDDIFGFADFSPGLPKYVPSPSSTLAPVFPAR